jgi:hypothetical protein
MSVEVGCRYCCLANGNENGCETGWCHFHDPERHAVLGPGWTGESSHRKKREPVRGVFATRRGSQVDNVGVLLVDGVWTTGATLDASARALSDTEARSVLRLTNGPGG